MVILLNILEDKKGIKNLIEIIMSRKLIISLLNLQIQISMKIN